MRLIASLPFLSLTIGFAFSSTGYGASPSTATVQEQAVQFYRLGRYEESIPLYQRLLRADPQNMDNLRDLMWVSWYGGRYDDVIAAASRIVATQKKDYEAWHMLARAYFAVGDRVQALKAFEMCQQLVPNEREMRLVEARLHVDLKDYDKALQILSELKERFPDYASVDPELARVLFYQGFYSLSAATWAKALKASPKNFDYRFRHAEALYYNGYWDLALSKLNQLAASDPPYWPAVNFLIEDAAARKDYETASRLLEDYLNSPHGKAGDRRENQLLRLAQFHSAAQEDNKTLSALNACLSLHPDNGPALLMKARMLKRHGKHHAALAVYDDVLARNPWNFSAYVGKAEALAALGRPQKALEAIVVARKKDESHPYLRVLESEYLFQSGNPKAAKALLVEWLDKNQKPSFPVLLYHGLSPFKRSPIFSYPVHKSMENFEQHIQALHGAGWSAITVEDVKLALEGKRDLPKRAVLITFDDGRRDSFRYGDPILKKYGYKATMFVPTDHIESSRPLYASWKEVKFYETTGRWETQSHGDLAHRPIPVDEGRREGLFLINRKWLSKENRLETSAEWKKRIQNDHDRAKKKIEENTASAVTAFAFPEGNFGQDGIPNEPEAVPANLELARQLFSTAYTVDSFGFNSLSRDRAVLSRLNPPAEWTGARLLRHLADKEPAAVMIHQLLRHAASQRKTSEAQEWFERLKARGASEPLLLVAQARVRLSAGDSEGALKLAQQALELDPSDEELQSFRRDIRTDPHAQWASGFQYQEDSRDRESWAVHQTVGDWRWGSFLWTVKHRYAVYRERNAEKVAENGAGVQIGRQVGLRHRVDALVLGHALSGGNADDTYSASGSLKSSWTDKFATQFVAGRFISSTARALAENVADRSVSLLSTWAPDGLWQASLKGRFSDLSDDNQRRTASLGVSRELPWLGLRGIFRMTLDSMNRVSPFYYSPQDLNAYQIGLGFERKIRPRWDLDFLYLTGYGKEKGSSSQWIHDADLGLHYHWNAKSSLRPSFALAKTPTYRQTTYSLLFIYQF